MGIIRYLKDTRAELKHVNWPTRSQTTIFTIIVIVVSFIVAYYLGLFDFIFSSIIKNFVL